jgi:hypothetical protein
MSMTRAQFEREKNYRVSLAIAKNMLEKGLINRKEFNKVDSMLVTKYQPVIGGL